MSFWRNIFSRRTPETPQDSEPSRKNPFWCGGIGGRSPSRAAAAMDEVLSPSRYVTHEEAAAYVADFMREARPRHWLQLYGCFSSLQIYKKDIADLATLYHSDVSVELLGVASLNGNGHIRQAAIEAFEKLDHSRMLPYVLVRLFDWVPQVRDAAEAALDRILRGEMAPEFFKYAFLIKHFEKIQRVDLSHVRRKVYDFLRSTGERAHLEANLTDDDPQARMFCYDVLADELPDRPDLIEKAIGDSHPLIRRWIVRFILENQIADPSRWLCKLLHDKCSRVQTYLIRNMTPQMQQDLLDELQGLVGAESPSVRGAARFVLRKHGRTDSAAMCRQMISNATDGGVRPGWIAGLGETGTAADYDLAEGFLQHRLVRIRAAAFGAIVRLDSKRALPEALEHLGDPNRKIRSTAVALLTSELNSDIIARMRTMLKTGSPRARISALTVLAKLGGWEVVPHALKALQLDDEKLTLQAWRLLSDWHGRYFYKGWIKPSAEVMAQIDEQLGMVESSNIEAPPNLKRGWDDIRNLVEERRKR